MMTCFTESEQPATEPQKVRYLSPYSRSLLKSHCCQSFRSFLFRKGSEYMYVVMHSLKGQSKVLNNGEASEQRPHVWFLWFAPSTKGERSESRLTFKSRSASRRLASSSRTECEDRKALLLDRILHHDANHCCSSGISPRVEDR